MVTRLKVSNELAEEIQHEAATRGLAVEEFLREIIQRERTLADRQKIEEEQSWWLSQPLSVRAKYEGQYVAIHNKALVDHDKNKEALRQRIRAKYNKTAVLIIPAEGPHDIFIRSPRLIAE